MINIDDFKKVEIRIGHIISAEKVEDADKLLKLSVDFGEESRRQIISGISSYYPDPKSLEGKKFPFVTNLEPRTIKGNESQGMIMAAKDTEGNFSLLECDQSIAPGTLIS